MSIRQFFSGAGAILSGAVTGEIHYVDGGYNIMGMPKYNN